MKSGALLSFSIAVAALLPAAAGPARAGSCPGGWIDTGDLLAEVHRKCGDPSYWDQRLEEFRVTTPRGLQIERSRTVDEWTYDRGPDRLVQILTFHDGRLVRIRSGGHGGLASRTGGDRPALVSVGDSKASVLLRWGEPTSYEDYTKTRSHTGPRGGLIQRTVRIERLTYDFGPRRLIRVLTFVDGKLKRKRTAGRGSHDDRDD
jgi:hypothetical protein